MYDAPSTGDRYRSFFPVFFAFALVQLLLPLSGQDRPLTPEQLEQPTERLSGDEVREELDRLLNLWKSRTDAIKTIEVEGMRFIGVSRNGAPPLYRDEFFRFVEQTILPLASSGEADLDSYSQITEPLFTRNGMNGIEGKRIGAWNEFRFLKSDSGTRNDDLFRDGTNSRIREKNRELIYIPRQQQASVYPITMHQLPLRSETVEDFFFEPIGIRHNVIKLKGWSSYGIRKFGNGMASLEFGKCRIEYREKDGFVFRDLRRFEAGDYYKERLQYLPAEIGESTAAAKLIVDITYAKGVSDTVQRVQMYSLRHVGVNKSMDSNTFKLRAPKGTKIVKFTERAPVIPGSDIRPSIEVANDKLDDVGSFVGKNGFGATGVPMSSRTTVP